MNVTNSNSSSNSSYPIVSALLACYASFLQIVGTCGNVLTIVLVLSDRHQRSISRLLLLCLCVCDTCVIWTAVLRYNIDLWFNYDIRLNSQFACVAHAFFTYLSTDMALGVLCIGAAERCLAMRFPLKSRRIITKRTIAMALLLMLILILMKHIPLLWIIELYEDNNAKHCAWNRLYCREYTCWHTWLEFVTHTILPYVILIPSNAILYCTMRRSAAFLRQHSNHNHDVHSGLSASRILLRISILQFCFALPGLVYVELMGLYRISIFNDIEGREQELLYNGLLILSFTTNCVNFFVVYGLSEHFQNAFNQLLHCHLPTPAHRINATLDLQKQTLSVSYQRRHRNQSEI